LKAKAGQHLGRSGALVHAIRKVKTMPLIQLLEVLIVVGVLLWLVNRFIPMQSSIKSILNGVVVIAVVLWLLNVFGLFHSLSHIRVGKG
jgi:protein-S-isoprenylcysteine O-methyltransferase Ste14